MATMSRGCEPRINRCCVELHYGTVLADLKRGKWSFPPPPPHSVETFGIYGESDYEYKIFKWSFPPPPPHSVETFGIYGESDYDYKIFKWSFPPPPPHSVETFVFYGESDYEYKIFSILRKAHAWSSVS